MTRRSLLLVLASMLSACGGGGEVLYPDGSIDLAALFGDRASSFDRTGPNDLGGPTNPTAVGLDGAVIGTVVGDGAVIAPDGAVVGGALPDGAVVAPDGALIGSVDRDATVPSMDAMPPIDGTPPTDGTSPTDGVSPMDGPAPTPDGGFPVEGDSAVRVDARLPDGGPACPTGWRACEDLCIAPGTCCPSDACPGGRVCSAPGGRCACYELSRMCGEQCLPQDACCGDADCPAPYRCRGSVCVDANGCNVGLRGCNGMCIPIGNCCTTADCRGGGTCPRPGSLCEGGDTCAIGARLCDASRTCIPERTCCTNADCAGGLVCLRPGGQCGCAAGQRFCGAVCIPTSACCVDDDCPLTSCPGVGRQCPPVPPRIAVKRWGIDRLTDREGMLTEPPVYRRYELTTTMAEEDALRLAVPGMEGDTPRLALTNERYFTIYGPGVCPRNTAVLWGLDQPPVSFPRADHILTISQTERDLLVRDGWRAVQVGCAVAPSGTCPAGTIAVSRYGRFMADPMVERHRFTATAADGMTAFAGGYYFESLGFCAF